MNIADKLFHVRIFLTDDGFVSILKQVTMATVTPVETNRISGQKPAHYRRDRGDTCP